jgi:hypothetical protein
MLVCLSTSDWGLGIKPLLVFVKGLGSLSVVMIAWETPAFVSTTSNRGNLSDPWVIGWIFCALEFYISVLNRVKVSKISTACIDWHLHRIERGVLDSFLEPEGLKILGKRRDPVLLEVCMLVVLLNVKIHILVKIKVLVVSHVPEGMQLGHNGAPC